MTPHFDDLYIVNYDGDWCIMNGDHDSVIYFASEREQVVEVCEELRGESCEDCQDPRCHRRPEDYWRSDQQGPQLI